MTHGKAERFRGMGKSVDGPLEDKALKPSSSLEDKSPPLGTRSVGELRKAAKAAGIPKYSSMNKAKLLEVLNG